MKASKTLLLELRRSSGNLG